MSLSKKVIAGGGWVFGLRIINKGFGLIRTIVLAKLLQPEDFGLLGIALLAISLLEIFSHTGFDTALTQKKGNVQAYLNSAWTCLVLRGLIICIILYTGAPAIAQFFNSPAAVDVIRLLALVPLMTALRNIGIVFLWKDLNFERYFIFELCGAIANAAVSIPLALLWGNIWALVWGVLSTHLIMLGLSYVIHPYRPRFALDFSKIKQLLGYGKWVFLSNILVFCVNQGDDLFVGKLIGATALGLYQVAYLISNLPATEIAHTVSRVCFPAYAQLQDDLPKLKEAYLKVIHLTVIIAVLMTGGILLFAADFTRLFLNHDWLPAVPLMQILVFAGLMRSIAATSGALFQAIGKPKIDTCLQVIRFSILALLIYPAGTKFGLTGISFAVFLSIFISNVGSLMIAARITQWQLNDLSKKIVLPLIVGGFGFLLTAWMKRIMEQGLVEFGMLVLIWLLVYTGLTYIFDKLFNCRIGDLVFSMIEPFRRIKGETF